MDDFDLKLLPEKVVRAYLTFPQRNEFVPVSLENDSLLVLVLSAKALPLADHLAWKLGKGICTKMVDEDSFFPVLEQALALWEEEQDSGHGDGEDAVDRDASGRDLLGWSHEDAPIVRLVNKALHQAISQGASDIHFELQDRSFIIRYRRDGELRTVRRLDQAVQPTVLARIKVMGHMDVAESRVPQDGRFQVRVGNRDIDLRVSTMPTLSGEKAVLRILDRSKNILSLSELGLEGEDMELFRRITTSPYGIILVTGPTGSGKTTTLYAALSELVRESLNIMTVEDPVEYHLPGINQVQVNRAAGVTFATAVRGFLRQDPDIILVGEIRDVDTAQIAVQAALTGHLVFSTSHTNDAATTLTRLVDLGLEPYLINASLEGVVAQRLVRRICPNCKEEYTPGHESLLLLGLDSDDTESKKFYRGRGCQLCNNIGYKGRMGIFEILNINDEVRDLLTSGASTGEIRMCARKHGARSLRQSGLLAVFDGETTVEEVARATITEM